MAKYISEPIYIDLYRIYISYTALSQTLEFDHTLHAGLRNVSLVYSTAQLIYKIDSFG